MDMLCSEYSECRDVNWGLPVLLQMKYKEVLPGEVTNAGVDIQVSMSHSQEVIVRISPCSRKHFYSNWLCERVRQECKGIYKDCLTPYNISAWKVYSSQ